MSSDEEEARRIAEMGKPVLGEHAKIEIIIEESYEFKVSIPKMSETSSLLHYGRILLCVFMFNVIHFVCSL